MRRTLVRLVILISKYKVQQFRKASLHKLYLRRFFTYLSQIHTLAVIISTDNKYQSINKMAKIRNYKSESLKTSFNGINVYTQPMKVKDVLAISYVAVRGRDKEEGAVQRVLSNYRVKQIREYVLQGKIFFNTFLLNWNEPKHKILFNNGMIEIPIVPACAQVIDGQHRLGGLQAAMEIDPNVGNRTVLVSFTIGLTTKEAAEIFLNINTEQKPVPKSLIYDLFGIVESDKEHAVNRAKDIAIELNENEDSPYYKLIKFPGAPAGYGIVDLSSFVSSLKNYLKPNGLFFNYNITDLNRQKTIFLNYFTAIKYFYDQKEIWHLKSKNPFLQSAGVVGAIEFFAENLLLKCSDKKSFSVDTLKGFLQLDKNELLTQAAIKGIDGKSARQIIKEYLENNLLADAPEQDDYEF